MRRRVGAPLFHRQLLRQRRRAGLRRHRLEGFCSHQAFSLIGMACNAHAGEVFGDADRRPFAELLLFAFRGLQPFRLYRRAARSFANVDKRGKSASLCVTRSGSRLSFRHDARRAAIPSFFSTSRKMSTPPSNAALTYLRETAGIPKDGGIPSFIAGVSLLDPLRIRRRNRNHESDRGFPPHPSLIAAAAVNKAG